MSGVRHYAVRLLIGDVGEQRREDLELRVEDGRARATARALDRLPGLNVLYANATVVDPFADGFGTLDVAGEIDAPARIGMSDDRVLRVGTELGHGRAELDDVLDALQNFVLHPVVKPLRGAVAHLEHERRGGAALFAHHSGRE